MANLRELLGENVKRAREAKGWSQERLAEETGLSKPTISSVENAASSTRLDVIEKLAGALNMSVTALLKGEKPPVVKISPREAWEIVKPMLDVFLSGDVEKAKKAFADWSKKNS